MTLATDAVALAAGPSTPAFLPPTTALVIAAAVIGYLSVRARVVPIVGFLLAGVLIGPAQLGLVDRAEAVEVAAEVGVILLLFTIGIEFSLDRLAGLWRYIVVGGGLQVALTTLVAIGVVAATGGSWQDGVFTGFLVSLSSTAIVLKLLADRREQGTPRGRLALAVLIFQDLAVVAMVLVVPELGSTADTGGSTVGLARALGVGTVVVALTLVVARRVMPPLLERVARTCSPEVFLLAVVALCFGTAYLTALAGVSVSLGAFLAGLVVSESRHGTHALSEVLPLQILFAAAFFVSVGMLLDLGFVLANLPLVLGGLLVVLTAKVAATTGGLLVLRTPWRTAAGTGLLLAQVGEFSFVLLTVGLAAGLTPAGLGEDGAQAAVAGTVLLMALTPLLAGLAARVDRRSVSPTSGGPVAPAERHAGGGHVLLLGWGDGAAEVARTLRARGHRVVVTTLSPDLAAEAERLGAAVVRGDASRATVLEGAGARGARAVVVAEHDAADAIRVAAAARRATSAPIVVRTPASADVGELVAAGADHVVDTPRHSHASLVSATLGALGEPPAMLLPVQRTTVDVTRVVDYRLPEGTGCAHAADSRPVLPSSPGCEDCLREGVTDWVHLRVCLTCGHVGCCDSSPGRHATAHRGESGHPLIASAEPGETWAYCYVDDVTVPAPATSPQGGRG